MNHEEINQMSDTELEALGEAILSALELRRNDKARESQKRIVENVDVLLKLTPNHGPTSCSDGDPNNSLDFRCQRCALLYMKSMGYIDSSRDEDFNRSTMYGVRIESTLTI